MHIDHFAIWTPDLERLRDFYKTFFAAESGPLYESARRPFRSYFLTFASGARLELMALPQLGARAEAESTGYAHMAFSAGSKEAVDTLTDRLASAGHQILAAPRQTGDGCYESVIADPDGNWIEITD